MPSGPFLHSARQMQVCGFSGEIFSQNLDYLALHYPEPPLSGMAISLKMGVSTTVTMEAGSIFCACADAHMHCCLSIKWVDQSVISVKVSG